MNLRLPRIPSKHAMAALARRVQSRLMALPITDYRFTEQITGDTPRAQNGDDVKMTEERDLPRLLRNKAMIWKQIGDEHPSYRDGDLVQLLETAADTLERRGGCVLVEDEMMDDSASLTVESGTKSAVLVCTTDARGRQITADTEWYSKWIKDIVLILDEKNE